MLSIIQLVAIMKQLQNLKKFKYNKMIDFVNKLNDYDDVIKLT